MDFNCHAYSASVILYLYSPFDFRTQSKIENCPTATSALLTVWPLIRTIIFTFVCFFNLIPPWRACFLVSTNYRNCFRAISRAAVFRVQCWSRDHFKTSNSSTATKLILRHFQRRHFVLTRNRFSTFHFLVEPDLYSLVLAGDNLQRC